jgi:hypothetical protein
LWKVNAILKLTFFSFRHGKITQQWTFIKKICDFISHVKLTFKIESLSIALSRIKYDNVKITRKGGAGLQRDNNLAGKIQREWTLLYKTVSSTNLAFQLFWRHLSTAQNALFFISALLFSDFDRILIKLEVLHSARN